jgi:hypothetical protein
MYKYGIFRSNYLEHTFELCEVIKTDKEIKPDSYESWETMIDSDSYKSLYNGDLTQKEDDYHFAIQYYLVELSDVALPENVLECCMTRKWFTFCVEDLNLDLINIYAIEAIFGDDNIDDYDDGYEFTETLSKQIEDFSSKEKYDIYLCEQIFKLGNRYFNCLLFGEWGQDYICSIGDNHYGISFAWYPEEQEDFIHDLKRHIEKTGENFGFSGVYFYIDENGNGVI